MTDNEIESINAGIPLVTFQLGKTTFGIKTGQVQEISLVGRVTPVHHAPPYVIGIRNLRGRIVTVIDLRLRLDLSSKGESIDSRIIIVEWQGEPVGLLVDRIADTVFVDPANITPPPANMKALNSRNLLGISRDNEQLVALLDLDVVLALEDRWNQMTSNRSDAA